MFYLVYMNVGPDSGAYLTIAITPSTTTTSTSRTWEIKVSQFLCKDRDLYVYHKVLCKNVLSINIRDCSFKKGHHQDVCNGLSDIPEDGRLSTLMLPHQVTDNILLLKGTFFTNQFYEWFKKIVLTSFTDTKCVSVPKKVCAVSHTFLAPTKHILGPWTRMAPPLLLKPDPIVLPIIWVSLVPLTNASEDLEHP